MKASSLFLALTIASGFLGFNLAAAPTTKQSNAVDVSTLKIGIVSFKTCVDTSKLGKQEQSHFDEVKKQMEASIEEKETELNEMANKFNDEFLDTLSPEAEAELKEKFRALSQDVSQKQGQYYQMLNQTNFQTMQKIAEYVSKASDKVAKAKGFQFVFNDEATFFYHQATDISREVVAEMDLMFDQEAKVKPATVQDNALNTPAKDKKGV